MTNNMTATCAACGGRRDRRAKSKLCIACVWKHRQDTGPDRFWAHVIKGVGRQDCWGWRGSKHLFGYGKMRLTGPRRNVDAHRYSWELHLGPIPAGLSVLHKCDNPACTNPEHLFLGTTQDNMDDMRRKGRHAPPPASVDKSVLARGERVGGAKLKAQNVLDIVAKRKGGASLADLAAQYGVCFQNISNIMRGKIWRHVTHIGEGLEILP